MIDIRKFKMEECGEFITNQLADINDFELLILKGHILVEYMLNCYLESISNIKDSDFFREKLTFSMKLNMARHFGELGNKEENINQEVQLLNKLRNDIAHNLSYNEKHLSEFYSHLGKKNTRFKSSDVFENEFEKFKSSILFLCGAIFTAYKLNTDKEDVDNYLKET